MNKVKMKTFLFTVQIGESVSFECRDWQASFSVTLSSQGHIRLTETEGDFAGEDTVLEKGGSLIVADDTMMTYVRGNHQTAVFEIEAPAYVRVSSDSPRPKQSPPRRRRSEPAANLRAKMLGKLMAQIGELTQLQIAALAKSERGDHTVSDTEFLMGELSFKETLAVIAANKQTSTD